MRTHHENRPGSWLGLLLAALGGVLLARELGVLPAGVRVIDFWPLIPALVGASSLLRVRSFWGAMFALALLASGGVLLAGNLGLIAFPTARLWPGLLVLLGLAFLIGGAQRPEWRGPPPPEPRAAEAELGSDDSDDLDPTDPNRAATRAQHGPDYPSLSTDEDRLNKQVTFSGLDFKIESPAWRGGVLGVIAGGVELDLRYARLDPRGAVLDVRIVMGGVDIRVPDTWQVKCDVTPLLGGADDATRSTQGSPNAPTLRVTGSVTLGGLSIHN